MTLLEQFNKEVIKETEDTFYEMFNLVECHTGETKRDNFKIFITQKLTEHKALILKMVREKAPEFRLTDDCARCTSHNAAIKEFLNNLDTI